MSIRITVSISHEIDAERYRRAIRALSLYATQDEGEMTGPESITSHIFTLTAQALTGGLFGFLEALRIEGAIVEYAIRTVARSEQRREAPASIAQIAQDAGSYD